MGSEARPFAAGAADRGRTADGSSVGATRLCPNRAHTPNRAIKPTSCSHANNDRRSYQSWQLTHFRPHCTAVRPELGTPDRLTNGHRFRITQIAPLMEKPGPYFRPMPVPLMAVLGLDGGAIFAGANPLVTIVLPLISPALLCTPPLIPGPAPSVLAPPRGNA